MSSRPAGLPAYSTEKNMIAIRQFPDHSQVPRILSVVVVHGAKNHSINPVAACPLSTPPFYRHKSRKVYNRERAFRAAIDIIPLTTSSPEIYVCEPVQAWGL